jgi:hypothetical protein
VPQWLASGGVAARALALQTLRQEQCGTALRRVQPSCATIRGQRKRVSFGLDAARRLVEGTNAGNAVQPEPLARLFRHRQQRLEVRRFRLSMDRGDLNLLEAGLAQQPHDFYL